MSQRRTIKRVVYAVIVVLLFFVVVIGLDEFIARNKASQAKKVRIGDSKEQVQKLLGQPDGTYLPMPEARTNMLLAMLSVSSETWAYGSNLDDTPFQSEFPYFNPFRFRIICPYPDDVAIEFDSSGIVTNVIFP